MKIIFVMYSYLPHIGGVELQMQNEAVRLVQKGHEVIVVTSNTIDFGPAGLKKEEYIDGVRVKRFTNYRIIPYKYLYFTPGVIPFLLKQKTDIIQIFTYMPTFITNVACLVSKIKRTPLVLRPIFHPLRSMSYSSFLQKALMFFYDNVIGFVMLKLSNAVMAQTTSEAEFYRRRNLKGIYVIPVGLLQPHQDSEKITTTDLEEFRHKFGIKGSKIALSVGRLERRKGFDLLTKAFAKVCYNLPGSMLLIVGEDRGLRNTIEKLAQDLEIAENIVFTGILSRKELYCAYEIASLVVQSSLFETYFTIAQEAWAHSKPIVVFDKFSFDVTPETGILVRYLDIAALAEAMIKLFSDPDLAQRLGKQGFKSLKGKYDWDRIVDEMEELYKRLLRDRGHLYEHNAEDF